MKRAVALCGSDEIGEEFLNFSAKPHIEESSSAGISLRDVERRLLETTLAATGGNRTRTAELLGISLRTVRNKIRDYGLPPRRFA
jgi:DNA-binding NtrC family response regulator